MEFLMENVHWILGVVCILGAAGVAIWKFSQSPTAEQIAQVKVWLLDACTQAETELASDAGQEKLQLVYERFEAQFPAVALAVSFATFSKWVDAALDELQKALGEESEETEENQISVE